MKNSLFFNGLFIYKQDFNENLEKEWGEINQFQKTVAGHLWMKTKMREKG